MNRIVPALFLLLLPPAFSSPSPPREGGSPLLVSLDEGWLFKGDPGDTGLKEGWADPWLDDSKWRKILPGRDWESQGYKADGVGWYRLHLDVPAGKGRLFLAFDGVDDEYTLFVNGRKIARFGGPKPRNSVWNRRTYAEITSFVKRPGPCLVALRVVDWFLQGGLRGRVWLTDEEKIASGGAKAWLRELAKRRPEWILPGWLRGRPAGWTMTGRESGISEALVSEDGIIQPGNRTAGLSFAVAVEGTGRVYSPEKDGGSLRLLSGGGLPQCPVPVCRWKTGPGLVIESSHMVLGAGPGPDSETVGLATLTVKNEGRTPLSLEAAAMVRPFGVRGPAWVRKIAARKRLLLVDGRPFLLSLQDPASFHALEIGGREVSQVLPGKEVPGRDSCKSALGLAEGAWIFPVRVPPGDQVTLSFLAPVNPAAFGGIFPSPQEIPRLVRETLEWWASRLGRVKLSCPEPSIPACFQASLGYILVGKDGAQLHPGPLAYDNFWYRDSAYMLAALNRAGLARAARDTVDALAGWQEADGKFPSIVNLSGKCVGPDEWDSQGQAMFSIVDHYRFTGDRKWLSGKAGVLEKSARFLRSLRARRLGPKWKGRPEEGILPPSVSAEDLGPGSWHHYWDDFWAVLGLRDATLAFRVLGKERDASDAEALGRDLLAAVDRSIAGLIRAKGIHWIPNGPEDLEGTSMARGTSPAVWPGDLYPRPDALLYSSFDEYWKRWIEPYGGAYFHQGRIWPYGMELAQCYVVLGERKRAWKMLRWHLGHQTLPGVYAWGEQVRVKGHSFLSGDMPHCWVAADYVNLARSLFLFERPSGVLVLGAGAPLEWWKEGFGVEGAPTWWGEAAYTVEAFRGGWKLTVSKAPEAPAGFQVWLPAEGKILSARDSSGKALAVEEVRRPDTGILLYRKIDLPAAPGVLRVEWEEGE